MKRRIICACRIHFNFLLETREAHNHNGSTKHHQPFHQQASHTKKCSKLYTYWISFENLNIWLLLPVWKIEQFSGRTCCEVILCRQKQLRTARATPTKRKNIMKEEKFLGFCSKTPFSHSQRIYTHSYLATFLRFRRGRNLVLCHTFRQLSAFSSSLFAFSSPSVDFEENFGSQLLFAWKINCNFHLGFNFIKVNNSVRLLKFEQKAVGLGVRDVHTCTNTRWTYRRGKNFNTRISSVLNDATLETETQRERERERDEQKIESFSFGFEW